MNIEVIRYRLPVYWACALINGDYTGLSDEEEREINNFLEQAEGYLARKNLKNRSRRGSLARF